VATIDSGSASVQQAGAHEGIVAAVQQVNDIIAASAPPAPSRRRASPKSTRRWARWTM
jgi:uncharacterized membrane protein